MIEGLKPYPEMKESGVPGVGAVPAHWEVLRAKHMFREVDERSEEGSECHLAMSQQRGLVPRSSLARGSLVSASYAGGRLVRTGDIVLNRLKAHLGVFAQAEQGGVVSPDYTVLRPRAPMVPRFFAELLRSDRYRGELRTRTRGIVEGFWRLYTEDFYGISLCHPPLEEQALIVRFLDHADRHVRRLIAAKQRLSKLLEEQRRAVIDAVLTRGHRAASRRPSGVHWIGEIPAGWEVVPLRRRWRVLDCKHLTVPFVDDGEYPLASVREVQSFDLSLAKAKRTTAEWHALLTEGDRKPRNGDVIYCRNVVVGAAAVVGPADDCAMGQDVCLIRSDAENGRFLNYYLRSPMMARQLALVLIGSTFNRINVADVKALLTLVPPRTEQDGIVAHLDRALVNINQADGQARAEITLLREYRTRLISDVVTGKLDVRAAAAALPDEVDPTEPVDDADADEAEDLDEPADESAE